MKIIAIVKYGFAVVGFGMLVAAALLAVSARSFAARASTAEGTVVELAAGRSGSRTYHPVVEFTGPQGRRIEFRSSSGANPPAYARGQRVRVLYDPAEPDGARLEGWFELFGGAAIVGGIGAVFFAIGAGILAVGTLRRRRGKWLQRHGTRIEAAFQRVEPNEALTVNGRHPFRIVSQWLDPATGEVHVFESENLWFDPTAYVRGTQITVFIERGNPRRYHVDVSFLPKLAA